MEMVLVLILLAFLAYVGVKIGCSLKKDEKQEEEMSDCEKIELLFKEAMKKEENQPRNLLLRTLKEIGCRYKEEDDGTVTFLYQGESFIIYAKNESFTIRILNVGWMGVKMNTPEAECLKQVINEANATSWVTNLYTEDKKRGLIVAHSQNAACFVCSLPDCKSYLEALLHRFFASQQQVRELYSDFSKKHEQQEKRVEIKGFRTD